LSQRQQAICRCELTPEIGGIFIIGMKQQQGMGTVTEDN